MEYVPGVAKGLPVDCARGLGRYVKLLKTQPFFDVNPFFEATTVVAMISVLHLLTDEL